VEIESLRKMIGTARDSAMLRLTLARLLREQDEYSEAESHIEAALEMSRGYTAAWKELGRIRQQSGDREGAAEAWGQGIEIARRNGDKQAEKEMTVFLKRLER